MNGNNELDIISEEKSIDHEECESENENNVTQEMIMSDVAPIDI